MNTRHDNTRQHIIDCGKSLIAGKGFTSVGLSEILKAAGVPKGSFYHYFESKEQFGQALLQDHFATYLERIDALSQTPGTGRERLERYWGNWMQAQSESCNEQKCLVVKLGGEVSDLSDAMRLTLRDGTEQIVARLAALLEAGSADGSLPALAPRETALTLYQLWLGASLLGKLHRTRAPLENAMAFTRRLFDQ